MEQELQNKLKTSIRTEMADCFNSDGKRKKNIPTCKLSEESINDISYFLAHKIPKCHALNITLDNIRNGKILGKGSFGYSFLVTKSNSEKVIIKIIVCDRSDPDLELYKQEILDEINIHIKLTQLEDVYNKFIAKIFGYISKDEIKSLLGTKSLYNYHDAITNNIICNFPSKKYTENCEIYLFMEVGNHDLSKYITGAFDKISFDDLTNLFFDFMNFYKISEGIIKPERKIFIHSDIKPENIIIMDNKGKVELKLIDFGVSILSDSFNDSNSSGTEYMYKGLFTHEATNKYKQQIAYRSPLFDVFSVIMSYLQIVLHNSIKRNIVTDRLKFDDIIIILEDKVKTLTSNPLIIDKVHRILELGNIIYKFHQVNINNYVDSYGNVALGFDEKIEKYEDSIRIINLGNINTKLPKYVNDVTKYKVQTDYEYFDSIMKYYLFSDFLHESSI